MATLALDRISKLYGTGSNSLLAVDNLDVEIADGEFMVFVGPSGCGKSTALRMVAGLETITDGELRIDGERVNELDPARRDIAMVFQNYALYPHMTVFRNIAYPLRIQGVDKKTIDQRVRATAKTLRLTELLGRRPGQLSGGQLQRVAMGRALVREPRAFLMDEPLSNLDAKLRLQMRSEITQIQRALKVTTIYVTHDQVEAMTMGDRVAVLRFGVLQQVATPDELFWHPANAFVASFVGAPPMNLFDVGLTRSGDRAIMHVGEWPIELDQRAAESMRLAGYHRDRVIVGLRPEHIELVPTDSPAAHLRGEVTMVEHLGTEILAHVDIGVPRIDGAPDARPDVESHEVVSDDSGFEPGFDAAADEHALVVRSRGKAAPSIGDTVALSIETTELRFFDAESRLAI